MPRAHFEKKNPGHFFWGGPLTPGLFYFLFLDSLAWEEREMLKLNVERVGEGRSERQGHVFISAHRDNSHNLSCGLQLRNIGCTARVARFQG